MISKTQTSAVSIATSDSDVSSVGHEANVTPAKTFQMESRAIDAEVTHGKDRRTSPWRAARNVKKRNVSEL